MIKFCGKEYKFIELYDLQKSKILCPCLMCKFNYKNGFKILIHRPFSTVLSSILHLNERIRLWTETVNHNYIISKNKCFVFLQITGKTWNLKQNKHPLMEGRPQSFEDHRAEIYGEQNVTLSCSSAVIAASSKPDNVCPWWVSMSDVRNRKYIIHRMECIE